MEFMCVPDTYYQLLRKNLQQSQVRVTEDLDILEVRDTIFSDVLINVSMIYYISII